MVRNDIITKEIDWLKTPEYRDVVTKEKLLKDIKTNIISLLNDYKGRGIENEAELIEEVKRMFTGGVVPSLVDWKILNLVLYELSEIKEQGIMYRNFIKDVSDSLGVTDLVKIRNFVEYIATLPPVAPEVIIEVDDFPKYKVDNTTATFDNDISLPHKVNRATVSWKTKEPEGLPYLKLTIKDAPSEDIEKYEVIVRAGSYRKTYTLDGILMGKNKEEKINIPIEYNKWFNNVIGNLSFYIEVVAIDRRGNKSSFKETYIYPPNRGIPQGFSTYNVQYQPTEKRSWQSTFGYTGDGIIKANDRSHGPVGLVDVDGNHKFRVRGYDPGAGWSEWAESPDYNLTFRGDPPGKPSPKITKRTINRLDFNWKPTANTDYYRVSIVGPGRNSSESWKIEPSSNPSSYFSANLRQGTDYTIHVRAYNEWYEDGILGTTKGKTLKRVSRTKTYYPLRHVRYNEQSWQPNTTKGFYRPRWDGGTTNKWGVDRPHWKKTESRTTGELIQGHWRETNWRLGKSSEWWYVARSGGAYRASDGQSHGNNATFVEMDYVRMRNDLRNATVTSATVSFKRAGSIHGWPGKGRPVYLYNHNQDFSGSAKRPSNHLNIYTWNRSRVSRNNNPPLANNNFKRKGYADIANSRTRDMVRNIQQGHMKGFAFIRYYSQYFHNTVHRGATDYIRFNANSFSVKVNYTVDE